MLRLKHLTGWLSAVAAFGIFAMMLITIADVLTHNLFHRPIRGTFELVELLLVIVVFLGIPEVFRSEGNITVDVIDHFVGSSTRLLLCGVALTVTLGFLLLLGFAMIAPAMDTISFPEHKQETGLPTSLFWFPILFGTAIATIATAGAGWSRLRSTRHAKLV
jgi:TRAP-type C4-dicarboxylate transport system permease small subunit